jgi:hypothetical protein
MGIVSGKDILSGKYLTAEITDEKNRVHYVPIKHTIGDYFVADIDHQIYAFSLKDARILTNKTLFKKAFQLIQYDTCNFTSLKPEIKELELMLIKNGLPKMDTMLHNVLRVLARREKKEFKEHSIPDLVATFAEHAGQFQEEVRNIKAYLDELDIDHIVTPVRKVTDFIQNDLVTTMPSFLGEAIPRYQRMDEQHKKMTNTPVKGTGGLMKIIAIVAIIIVGMLAVFVAYDQGAFDGITDFADNLGTIGEGFSGLPSPTGGFQTGVQGGIDYSDAAIQAAYTPEGLKIAINNGEVDYDKLSGGMKAMVDAIELPTVEAIP